MLLVCNNQTFGDNCVHQCDRHCINDEPCNKRDGTCEQCSLGWAGKFCNTSKIMELCFLSGFLLQFLINLMTKDPICFARMYDSLKMSDFNEQ